jgi:hypothetical protein
MRRLIVLSDIYTHMSEYKSYLMRQLGITESQFEASNVIPESVDPSELKKGIEVEREHTKDTGIAKKIALDHLSEDPKYYTRMEKCGLKEHSPFQTLSPTAKSPNIIGISIKGTPGGMMPTSLGQSDTAVAPAGAGVDVKDKAALGGWELVSKQTPNSTVVDHTPQNATLNSSAPIADDVEPTPAQEHPSQIQQTKGSEISVQSLTGTTDDDTIPMGDKPEPENFEVGDEDDEPESEFGLDDEAGGDNEEGNMSLASVTPKGDDVDDIEIPDSGEEEDEEGDEEEEEDENQPHMVKEECECKDCNCDPCKCKKSLKEESDDEAESNICSSCNGSGEGRHDGSKCTSCGGSGNDARPWGKRKREREELDETFNRHLKLMQEKLKVKECKPCKCDTPNTVHDKKTSKLTNESLQKMQEKFLKKALKSPLTEQEQEVSREIISTLKRRGV